MPTRPMRSQVIVRNTQPRDLEAICEICRRIYPGIAPWETKHLQQHLDIFPQGQLVAVDEQTQQVLGSASSLIINWDDYNLHTNWRDFTDNGRFTNHDTHGKTLYGADVMVDPEQQGRGIGKKIYAARREVARSFSLKRIRAGARLRGYHRYQDKLSPEEYAFKIINGEIGDPTLSFQIKQGFRVLGVVREYLRHDAESCGHAAVIEWVNYRVAQRRDTYGRDPRFAKHRKKKPSDLNAMNLSRNSALHRALW